MKNNKGFTLVELLAVIVVLALIIGVAATSAIAVSNRSKKKMYISKVDMIIKAAQVYGEDHPEKVVASETACSGTNLTVQMLVNDGKVKADGSGSASDPLVKDPYSGNDMKNLKFCVFKYHNRVYAKIMCNGTKWMDNNVDLKDEHFCD